MNDKITDLLNKRHIDIMNGELSIEEEVLTINDEIKDFIIIMAFGLSKDMKIPVVDISVLLMEGFLMSQYLNKKIERENLNAN